MGIRWIFESPETKSAFWWTFVLPFFGGFLRTGEGALALLMMPVGLFLIIISRVAASSLVETVFPQVSLGCSPGYSGIGCWGQSLTAAELSHNQLVNFATVGLWVPFVIGLLVVVGILAARQVRY